ncbi:MAG: hypothetical protein IKB86_05940, partial [Clostridia bacterium]|nr:hypothetical protein [Clostridia bacterium]
MLIFGIFIEVPVLIVGGIILLAILALIGVSLFGSKKESVSEEAEEAAVQEGSGDFHGLLTREDFENRAEDPSLEVYRMQWIKAAPGEEKDKFLLLYLALKQLYKEQDESEAELSQEELEARMDQILADLSAKTGIPFSGKEFETTQFDEFFAQYDEDAEYDEED